MPIRKLHLSKAERDEYAANRAMLAKLCIQTAPIDPRDRRPEGFKLSPIHSDFARIFDLPGDRMALALPAALTVLNSGVLFADAVVLVPEWPNCELDLEEPQEEGYADKLKQCFPTFPPRILNGYLVEREFPLRQCHLQGLIVGIGWTGVPPEHPDEQKVKLEIRVRDRSGLESKHQFSAMVGRELRRQYERRRQASSPLSLQGGNRISLFEHSAEPSRTHSLNQDGAEMQDPLHRIRAEHANGAAVKRRTPGKQSSHPETRL